MILRVTRPRHIIDLSFRTRTRIFMTLKRFLTALFGVLLVVGLYVFSLVKAPVPPSHQVFVNGDVLTMDSTDRIAEAVSVRDGVIDQVGSSAEIRALITDLTQVTDLDGRTLMPGLWMRTDTSPDQDRRPSQ